MIAFFFKNCVRPGTNVSALYVCSSQYILGTVVPTPTAWEFRALPTFAHARGGQPKHLGPVGGSAKGFWDDINSRYLIWHVSAIRCGFTLAREVSLDADLQVLLEYVPVPRVHPGQRCTMRSPASWMNPVSESVPRPASVRLKLSDGVAIAHVATSTLFVFSAHAICASLDTLRVSTPRFYGKATPR